MVSLKSLSLKTILPYTYPVEQKFENIGRTQTEHHCELSYQRTVFLEKLDLCNMLNQP